MSTINNGGPAFPTCSRCEDSAVRKQGHQWLCAKHYRFERQGYDAQTTSAGVYRWPEVQAMWRVWELMRTRAAAQGLFGGKEAA